MFIEERDDYCETEKKVDGFIPFVGRQWEREEIKTSFKKRQCRLRQIYGFPLMGKERLAQQVTLELLRESRDKTVSLRSITISCSGINKWECFICKLNNIYSQELRNLFGSSIETEDDFFSVLSRSLSDSGNYLLVTLTKCDDLTTSDVNQTKFVKFCDKLLNLSNNIFILVTNGMKLHFVSNNIVRFTKLNGLWPTEAKSLMMAAACDEDLDIHVEEIVRGCCYIPGLILDAVSILQHPEGLIKATSLCALLRSPERALSTFSMKHVNPDFQLKAMIEKLFQRILNHQMQKDILGLSLFNGSFSREAAVAVLGYNDEHEAVMSALVPLSDHAVLDVVRESGRFRLNPLFKTFVVQDALPLTIDVQNPAKLRFVKFFGEVLQKVDSDLYVSQQRIVPGYLHEDYDNVKEIMTAAMHCNEDMFKAIMKAVKSTEEIFIQCFQMEKVKDFYQNLLQAAEKFGDTEDISILKCLLGQTLATKKVDANTTAILKLYKEALGTLRENGSKYHLFILLGLIAQTLIRQGKYCRGLTYVHEALDVKTGDFDKKKVERRKINVLSQEAIAEVFLERNESATKLLHDTLELAQTVAPYHPDVPVMLNSLGLICERTGDNEQALYYYNFSLQERRPIAKTKPEILVPTLNNIGTQLMIRENYSAALDRLNEALKIRKQCGWNDYFTGLTLWNIGKVQLLMMNFEVALQKFEEAKAILKMCTPKHFLINEINISMAHCYQTTGCIQKAIEVYRSVLEAKDVYVKNLPRGEQTAMVFHHLLNLAESDNWNEIYNNLQNELHRLGKFAKDDDDQNKYIALQKRITDCRQLFTCWIENDVSVARNLGVEMIGKHCIFCLRLQNVSARQSAEKNPKP